MTATEKAPAPALKRLEKLVGTWDLTGRTLDSKEDNIKGWSAFEWLPGGFFMKVTGATTVKDFHVESLELIGYDPASDDFPAQVYANFSGDISPYRWNVQGNQVTHWEATSKYTGTLSPDGQTLSGGWRPIPGAPLSEGSSYDAVMTRRPDSRK